MMDRFSLFGSTPPVVKNLIIANVLMFLAMNFNERFMIEMFCLYYPASPFFNFMQPISHIFMHGDFFHLFFNMYVLWMFGCVIERVWGSKKFLIYYFMTGLGAAGVYLLSQWVRIQFLSQDFIANYNDIMVIYGTPCLGASGAVFGILLAFGMMYPQTELQLIFPPIRLKAIWLVVILVVIELVYGLSLSDHIAHFAHLGGIIFGFIIIQYWKWKGTLFRNDDYH